MSDEELEALRQAAEEAWAAYKVIDDERNERLMVWAGLNRRLKAEELRRDVRAEIIAEKMQ